MEFDLMALSGTWAETSSLARDLERAGFSGMLFTEAGQTPFMSIAAASIVAKVLRDRMMTRLAVFHPQYEFEKHAGYATARHLAALAAHGPCRHHRMTFSPMRQSALPF